MLEAVGGLKRVETLPSGNRPRVAGGAQEPPIWQGPDLLGRSAGSGAGGWEVGAGAGGGRAPSPRAGEGWACRPATAPEPPGSAPTAGPAPCWRRRRPPRRSPTAPALALLVGSYDGSGNYGDLAQLDAALGLLGGGDTGGSGPAGHRAAIRRHPRDDGNQLSILPARSLFLATPVSAATACTGRAPGQPRPRRPYLYGGGFLNPSWASASWRCCAPSRRSLSRGGRVTKSLRGSR